MITQNVKLAAKITPEVVLSGTIHHPMGYTDCAVLYTKQNLTEEQKAQARENIGVSTSGGLSITDDGEGNVSITSSGAVTITDDGNGNVVIA